MKKYLNFIAGLWAGIEKLASLLSWSNAVSHGLNDDLYITTDSK